MTNNTDPVRALIEKWQTTPYGKGDHDYYVDGLRACARELESTLASAPPSVPAGWPTDAMVIRGAETLHDVLRAEGFDLDFDHDLRGTERQQSIAEAVFGAMLAAAPSPEGQAEANYVHTVPDECETLHWRGQILSMNELADLASAPPSATVGVDEMQRRLDREESDHARTIDQRDAAEDALGRMFQAVTGRPAEWSSAWDYADAIEEVEEHVAALSQQPAAPHWGNVPELDDEQPAAPSGEVVGSDGRRERLLERRNVLNNSFGNGAYEDGRVQQQIDAIDAELAALAAPQQPAAVDEAMVFQLAVWMAKHDGCEDPHRLIYEGSPPVPWGEVWNRYEYDARAALTAALAAQQQGGAA